MNIPIAAAVVLAASTCASVVGATWSTWGGSNGKTNYVDAHLGQVMNNGNVSVPSNVSTAMSDGARTLAIHNGVAYGGVLSPTGYDYLVAYNLSSKEYIYRIAFPLDSNANTGQPTIDASRNELYINVAIVVNNRNVVTIQKFNLSTGAALWSKKTRPGLSVPSEQSLYSGSLNGPVLGNDTVFFVAWGFTNRYYYGFDRVTGEQVLEDISVRDDDAWFGWSANADATAFFQSIQTNTSSLGFQSLVPTTDSNGTTFFTTAWSVEYERSDPTLNPETNTVYTETSAGGVMLGQFWFSRGSGFSSKNFITLLALNATSGAQLWEYTSRIGDFTGGGSSNSPATDGEKVWLNLPLHDNMTNMTILEFDVLSGQNTRNYTTAAHRGGTPVLTVVATKDALLCSGSRYLSIFDRASGQVTHNTSDTFNLDYHGILAFDGETGFVVTKNFVNIQFDGKKRLV